MQQDARMYLISISRTLIVIGERNNRSAHAQYHRRMNFAVRIRRTIRILLVLSEIIRRHGYHNGFLL